MSGAKAVIIPARYASSRFPGKPLALIAGRPMIQWVYERAARAKEFDHLIVATDDTRIFDAVTAFGGRAVMTPGDLASGTDRVAWVARDLDVEVVVNLQGDEPFMPPVLIGQAAALLCGDESAAIATLATPIRSDGEFRDPNVVKVVTANDGAALYFSRSPIPFRRDGVAGGEDGLVHALRHVGIYAYRVGALRLLTALPPSSLELDERLEQLRALQGGMRIVVGICQLPPGFGVDTQDDLRRARDLAGRPGATSAGETT